MSIRQLLVLFSLASSAAFFATCSRSGNSVVGPSEPTYDFEGDVTKYNEACRDTILFASDWGGVASFMYRDGTGLRSVPTIWGAMTATWSPRKWKIFYIVDLSSGRPSRALFVMNVDGTGSTRITPPTEDVWAAACAPDGQKIAYIVLNSTGNGKIRIAKPDGSEARDVSDFVLWNQSPVITWSSDSRRVCFDGLLIDYPAGRSDGIGVANADGSYVGPLFIPPGQQCYNPNWSADGTRVAYVMWAWAEDGYYPNVFYYTIATQKSRQVTFRKGDASTPHWSPDGSRIMFASRKIGEGQIHLFLVNADGTGLVQLTTGEGSEGYPDW